MVIKGLLPAGSKSLCIVLGLTLVLCAVSCKKEPAETGEQARIECDQTGNEPAVIESVQPPAGRAATIHSALAVSTATRCRKLTNFCLDGNDNLLACDGADKLIRVIGPDDTLLAKWQLDFSPEAIDARPDGAILVAGPGKIALLDREGKTVRQGDLPGTAASGIGVSGSDIFVAVQTGTGFSVYRLDESLANPARIIKGLRGCCGQMDITARDGIVYVAANTLFKVVKYDRDGNELARFGEQGREGPATFKGCCEPKNVCFDTDGNLYTAESAQCCIKKFSADGKFLAPVGVVDGITGCVRVTIAITRDQTRFYMLDTSRNVIRTLELPKLTPASKVSRGVDFGAGSKVSLVKIDFWRRHRSWLNPISACC